MKVVPFSELNSLKKALKDKKLVYITNAKITTIDNIVDALNGNKIPKNKKIVNNDSALSRQGKQKNNLPPKDTGPQYIKAKKGSVYMDNPRIDLRKGSDFIPVNDFMKKYGKEIMNSPTIQGLLNKGFIEIISQKTMERIKEAYDEKVSGSDLMVMDLKEAVDGVKTENASQRKTGKKGPLEDVVDLDLTGDIRRPTGGDSNESTLLTGDE